MERMSVQRGRRHVQVDEAAIRKAEHDRIVAKLEEWAVHWKPPAGRGVGDVTYPALLRAARMLREGED